jgi:hypothetical protein
MAKENQQPGADPGPAKKPKEPAPKKADTDRSATDRTPLNIYQRMNKVMMEIDKVEKTGRNDTQNYKFIEQGAVVAIIREKLDYWGVRIKQSMVGHTVVNKKDRSGKDSFKIVTEFEFSVINVDKPDDSYTAKWFAEGDDSLDKGTNKAATAAEKYFLMKELKITDQNDPDAEAGEDGKGNLPYGLKRRPPREPKIDDEKKVIVGLFTKLGIPIPEIPNAVRTNGFNIGEMTHSDAVRLIYKLKDGDITKPTTEMPTIPDAGGTPPALPPTGSVAPPTQIVVDDDFKSKIQEIVNGLGLNDWGKQWFFRTMTGNPFGGFDSFKEPDWVRAFDKVSEIREGTLEVPDRYVAGVVAEPSGSDT